MGKFQELKQVSTRNLRCGRPGGHSLPLPLPSPPPARFSCLHVPCQAPVHPPTVLAADSGLHETGSEPLHQLDGPLRLPVRHFGCRGHLPSSLGIQLCLSGTHLTITENLRGT